MTVAQRYSTLVIDAPPQMSAPASTPLNLGDVRLDRVDLRFPPGPSGLVGVAIVMAGTQIWPWGVAGTWLIGNDETISSDIGTELDQGVTITYYNNDYYQHALYFRFLYTPMALVQPGVQSVPIVSVS